MNIISTFFLLLSSSNVSAFTAGGAFGRKMAESSSSLEMAAVGIFFGTSTGNTQDAADLIFEAFGDDVAAEPVDVDELEEGQLAQAFAEHDALVVGTPTWNTGADSERSGTGWDELYYTKLPELKSQLDGKKVAVFGLGDQVSYAENYADATGELFDVFSDLGCNMLGSWSQEGYEHEASKSIRGDKFCGLLLDMVNQEELSPGRVEQWVAQLIDEGILSGGGATPSIQTINGAETEVIADGDADLHVTLEENSDILDQNIRAHSSGGYYPHTNKATGRTMWISEDGRQSYFTAEAPLQAQTKISP